MVSAADQIMALFGADDVVLRPSEIVRRSGLKAETARTVTKRLVARGRLFHIGRSQYTRCATTPPLEKMRSDRIAALERRIEVLEAYCFGRVVVGPVEFRFKELP